MPELDTNDFISYKFNPDEALIAYSLTEIQTMAIRTEMTKVAMEKLNCRAPGGDSTKLSLMHEYLQGKIDAFKGLIMTSEGIRESMEERIFREQQQELQFRKG